MQELKSSGGVLYSVQTTLPEAGGRVGEVPVAVSWEWLPGAPCGSICCCEGRPACEFVGPYRLLGLCPQRWGAVASGLPKIIKNVMYIGGDVLTGGVNAAIGCCNVDYFLQGDRS